MLKVLELLSRRSDMTHEQSMRYWTERHATLVKASAADDVKTRRYVNNVGLSEGYETSPPFSTCPFDGIVAVWVERSFESLRKIILWPENSFVPDEPNFVRCRPYLMPVDEIVHKDLRRPHQSKLMVLFTRPHRATLDEAVRHWRDAHVRLEMDYWGDSLIRLTSNVSIPFTWTDWGQEMSAFDGCAEYCFDLPPEQVMQRIADSHPMLAASAGRCIGTSLRMFIREVVQIDRDA